MLRPLSVVLTVAVLLLGGTGADASGYTPEPGARFNLPRGTPAEQTRVVSQVDNTIASAPPGSTIRIAVYSFDRTETADQLIAAHERGVTVQMLVNDNWTSDQTLRLQSAIGSDRAAQSFVYVCHRSCRGRRGNLHSKFFLFTRAGDASNVVMLGSGNLTNFGVSHQWNDLLTVTNRAMLNLYTQIFQEMAKDQAMPAPYVVQSAGVFENRFSPHPDTTSDNDPVMERLEGVGCNGATNGTGLDGHAVMRIAAYGWAGTRGQYLADEVASLRRAGCDVKALVAQAGASIVGTLRRAGVEVRRLQFDEDADGSPDMYMHMKFMTLSGRYEGVSSWNVWTGSENWSGIALNNDDVVVRIPRKTTYTTYNAQFDKLWKKAT
jgi:hypothetical protein